MIRRDDTEYVQEPVVRLCCFPDPWSDPLFAPRKILKVCETSSAVGDAAMEVMKYIGSPPLLQILG